MMGEPQLAGSANAIVLGTVLDGIPESFVLGTSLAQEGTVATAVVVGVFVSNVPEALSGTTGLLQAGWARGRCSRCGAAWLPSRSLRRSFGRQLVDEMGADGGAFVLAFAAGAVLVMLADTLSPKREAGGREAGLLTALGFALGFGLS